MTNEEIQRTMEFILEQQAQFAASIQRAEEQRIRDTPRLTRLEDSFQDVALFARNTDDRFDGLADSYQVLVQLLHNSDERLERIEEQRIQDNERITRLEDSFLLLTHLAQRTDARLERLERPGG